MDYQVENEAGTCGNPTRNLPAGSDYLVGWVEQGIDREPEICLYGNPEGLRRLARNLMHVADLIQTDDENLSADDSYHCHLRTGLNSEAVDSLPALRIGRADSVGDEFELRDCFPAMVPEFSDCAIPALGVGEELDGELSGECRSATASDSKSEDVPPNG